MKTYTIDKFDVTNHIWIDDICYVIASNKHEAEIEASKMTGIPFWYLIAWEYQPLWDEIKA